MSTIFEILMDAGSIARRALVQAEYWRLKLEPSACHSLPRDLQLDYMSTLTILVGTVLLWPSTTDVQKQPSATGAHSGSSHLTSRIALLLTTHIAVQAAAVCRFWQAHLPADRYIHPSTASSAGSASMMGRRAQRKARQQQQQQQQQHDRTVLITASDALEARLEAAFVVLQACPEAADSRGFQAVTLAAEQAVSMILPFEVEAACYLGKEHVSWCLRQEGQQVALLAAATALESLMTKVHPSGRNEAAAALALTCSHTALPLPLRRSMEPGGRAPCAGPACDGRAYGMPMLLAELSQLCSVAAATTGEAATPQREVCMKLRWRLQGVLRCMGGGWPAALPPPPLWPPTEAEAAAQAASDDMMRLLLEVRCHVPNLQAAELISIIKPINSYQMSMRASIARAIRDCLL